MASLAQMGNSLLGLITPLNLALLLVSTCGGILIGALLAGLTYTMHQDMALIVLLGIYVGGIYGGSIFSQTPAYKALKAKLSRKKAA